MKFVKPDPIKDLPQDRTALYAVIKNNIDNKENCSLNKKHIKS